MNPVFDLKSDYQRIVLERGPDGLELRLNGRVQFCERTEKFRYGLLATIPLSLSTNLNDVVIFGGGDGLALRNVLGFPVRMATVVDPDAALVALGKRPPLSDLNRGSLSHPKARVLIRPVDSVLADKSLSPDVIIMDSVSFGMQELVALCAHRLKPTGVIAIRASGTERFWIRTDGLVRSAFGNAFTIIRDRKEAVVYGSRSPMAVRHRPSPDALSMAVVNTLAKALTTGRRVIVYNATGERVESAS